jgi:CubicO group peptidase (beta-lactamase class C family)
MRSHKLVAFVLTVFVLGGGCSGDEDKHEEGVSPGVVIGATNAAIDAIFADRNRPGRPGCAIAVAKNGTILYTRGYGYANLDYDIPVTPQTVFDVASITKQFVAASLTMLAQEGKLGLGDNVRRWLPELPEYGAPITLQHMIYHTSGLRDYLNLFPLAGRTHYYPISGAQILEMMSRQRALIFSPGEQYAYSNTAYMLLGEFTRVRIFEPLGMNGSLMYDDFERIIPRRATGYDAGDDGRVRQVHNYNFDVAGDGQMYTTVEDLLRWDDYLHGSVEPAIHAQMLAEGHLNNGDPTGYAQGIGLGEYRGQRTLQHTGSSWGARSVLMRFVDPALSIAIACNDGNLNPLELAHRVADHYLTGLLGPVADRVDDDGEGDTGQAHEPFVLDAIMLAAFTGTYFSAELDATYRITVDKGGLLVRIEQEEPLHARPIAEGAFDIQFPDQAYWDQPMATIEFRRDDAGAIDGFDLSSGSERGIGFVKRP